MDKLYGNILAQQVALEERGLKPNFLVTNAAGDRTFAPWGDGLYPARLGLLALRPRFRAV
ncbi:hypothetical protein IQ269_06495 [Tychonema sp. LEGE 07199]|uniref:hypothetical protein n=1 Tax=Microcoleaceae TaxID=1892252 RepID=UPI00187EDDE7|nr:MULTISPECIES: hypothetical protein [unclassified Tychonema]MBE9120467.1 hypothetical protein [Tychonema sp. LEGE 07199]MBE9133176.1 hypothetical protein [Tychonema sp. LEGE 07196]